jgi:hypothetical protein
MLRDVILSMHIESTEPLFLPRGSLRAIAALVLSVTSWVLMFTNQAIPNYLFGVLLTIIGNYFGHRRRAFVGIDKRREPDTGESHPLFLPKGFIRLFLISGFVVGGMAAYAWGHWGEDNYFEFFVVLGGLVVGYIFTNIVGNREGSILYAFLNHIKGLCLIAAVIYVSFILLNNPVAGAKYALYLSCFISFYFGSR